MTDQSPTDSPLPDADSRWESTATWREFLDGMKALDAPFLEGPKTTHDEQTAAEGYKFLATVMGVAFDIYLFSDTAKPRFVDINTPYRMDRAWGGDNTDAYYAFAPVDPQRTYRISGTRGDSVYFSVTIYNEPSPGQWSDRVVGIVNDADLEFGPDESFAFFVGPARPDGYEGPFVELTDDAAAAVTRDYQYDPHTGQRVEWAIETVEPSDDYRTSDAATARALRTSLRWVQEMFAVVPIPVTPRDDPEVERTSVGHNSPVGANVFAEPYQVPDANYGWSARDACYSFGTYALRADEALVVTFTPPSCRFWNFTVWNPFMAGYNPDYTRTSVNEGTAVRNADGSVTLVLAHQDHPHPNSISTLGHSEGMTAFRFFHAEVVPATPATEVVAVADAPTATT